MRLLIELLTKEIKDPQIRTTYQYVVDLKERREAAYNMAKENLEKSSEKNRKYYNRSAKNRIMSEAEKSSRVTSNCK